MKRLYRNLNEAKIGGVCAGIGNYFNIDPVIIRLTFLLLIFAGG
ncbi:MAG: PspC domain-containing protein [Candidatus Neomarinimicrobiota bacterium]